MPRGVRRTAGINTTVNQQKYRGSAIDTPQVDVTGATAFPDAPESAPVEQANIIEMRPPGEDEFSLTDEEKRSFGIGKNEEHCWIRDDRYWGKLAPGNRAREFLRQNAGSRIIYQDNEPVTNGTDLILAVRPKAEVEKLQARDKAIEDEHFRRMDEAYQSEEEEEFDPTIASKVEIRRRKMENTMAHIRSGMIGPNSPSSGMPYENYVRNRGLTPQQIEAEERSYSLTRVPSREIDQDQLQQPNNQRQRDPSGRFYSLPQNVRPRNLAQT